MACCRTKPCPDAGADAEAGDGSAGDGFCTGQCVPNPPLDGYMPPYPKTPPVPEPLPEPPLPEVHAAEPSAPPQMAMVASSEGRARSVEGMPG